jgi:hypothetical protein
MAQAFNQILDNQLAAGTGLNPNWMDLLDEQGNILDYAPASTVPYPSMNAANADLAAGLPAAVHNAMITAAIAEFSAIHNGGAPVQTMSDVVDELWPTTLVAAEKVYLTRVLSSYPSWGAQAQGRSFGDLLSQAFVILWNCREATNGRLLVEDNHDRDTHFQQVASTFINGLLANISIGTILGYNELRYKVTTVRLSTMSEDVSNPLFAFVGIPILKMGKRLFPVEFSWKQINSKAAYQHMVNIRNQARNYGVHSVGHVENHIAGGAAGPPNQFMYLSGALDVYFRSMRLYHTGLCTGSFTVFRHRGRQRTRAQSIFMTNQEFDDYTHARGFEVDIDFLNNQPTFYAHHVWPVGEM